MEARIKRATPFGKAVDAFLWEARGRYLVDALLPRFAERNVYNFARSTLNRAVRSELEMKRFMTMKLAERIKETGAAGYILLWLLGIPIPILFVIFLLRGCS